MCYVHNQWYDISCATLYIYQQYFVYVVPYTRKEGIVTNCVKRNPSLL